MAAQEDVKPPLDCPIGVFHCISHGFEKQQGLSPAMQLELPQQRGQGRPLKTQFSLLGSVTVPSGGSGLSWTLFLRAWPLSGCTGHTGGQWCADLKLWKTLCFLQSNSSLLQNNNSWGHCLKEQTSVKMRKAVILFRGVLFPL